MDEIFENKNLYINLLINKIDKSNQMYQSFPLVCAWGSVFRKLSQNGYQIFKKHIAFVCLTT